jgi:hypothetical protein
MVTLDRLCEAVREGRELRLSMRRDPPGASRTGEPHIVYESSAGNILLHVYQTAGYSSSGGLPSWRPLSVAEILTAEPTGRKFAVRWQEGYNPANRRFYQRIICAVE